MPVDVGRAIKGAAADLAQQRARRAAVLHERFIRQMDGADALVWARMADAVEDVRHLPQMQKAA